MFLKNIKTYFSFDKNKNFFYGIFIIKPHYLNVISVSLNVELLFTFTTEYE